MSQIHVQEGPTQGNEGRAVKLPIPKGKKPKANKGKTAAEPKPKTIQ